MVSFADNSLRTTVYRKPTHTDRLLDESSYNPTSHKATTIRTLTRRAQLVCNTTDSLSDENKYLNCIFSKNNHNEDFMQCNTHRPTTTTTEANDNATPTTTATKGAYLRSSRASYNHSISASLTNLSPHNVSYRLTSKTRTNRGTDLLKMPIFPDQAVFEHGRYTGVPHTYFFFFLSRNEVVQERKELFRNINDDAFFPIKSWPADMKMIFC